jgi:hypothetical protein
MGNHAFWRKQYNNLPRVKNDSKPVFLIETVFENASAEVCLRKCGLTCVFTNGFGILSGKF